MEIAPFGNDNRGVARTMAYAARTSPDAVTVERLAPARAQPSIVETVRAGLNRQPRYLPSELFYDARGAELFDRICELPAYHLTRAEAALLREHAPWIADRVRPASLVELGAGTARKTEHLLQACDTAGLDPEFWPLDVCESALHDAGTRLTARFPWLRVRAFAADHAAALPNLPAGPSPRLFVFLGNSLGNLVPPSDQVLLKDIARRMGRRDRVLLGVDPVTDPRLLHAAYDDPDGINAAFNKNIINVVNRQLESDIPADAFRHRIDIKTDSHCVETYLECTRETHVHLPVLGETHTFTPGECIQTDVSRKFTSTAVKRLFHATGLRRTTELADPRGWFSLHLAARI